MNNAIAIVGAACVYPDATSPTELWENVLAGRRAFRRLPACRLNLDDYLSDDPQHADTTYASQAAVIDGYEFDRAAFRVVGSTFRAADMAHWLALDVAARTLADAGFPNGEGLAKEQVGVLVGNSLTGEFSRAGVMRLRWPYVRRTLEHALAERGWSAVDRGEFLAAFEQQFKEPFPPVGDETLAGGLSNTIAGRIANYFDFGGGAYTVDGACASSLLAVANACSALVARDLDVALAGGVDLSLDPFELVGFAKVGALAKSEMRVFDARSAGFFPGEGCGMVALMRVEDAVVQGRRIYALIRGWGISSDGAGGITRPDVDGQKLALRRAYQRAGFGIDTVGYFEGHGTGTAVGDAIELESLIESRAQSRKSRAGANGQALDSRPSALDFSAAGIGSVKAHIGHTKAAAGVAGLIKATLALHHQVLPPSVGWEQPHPLLQAENASLRLLRQAERWPIELPLRAAVSAMGFGGINAHLVLEGVAERSHAVARRSLTAREARMAASPQDAELFVFAGRDRADLAIQIRRVAAFAAQLALSDLVDLAAALAADRQSGFVRAAVVASRPADLTRSLDTLGKWLADGVDRRLDVERGLFLVDSCATGSASAKPDSLSIGLLFPGQGSPASITGGAWRYRYASVKMRYDEARFPPGANSLATEVAHLAIITATLAGLDVLQRLGIEATVGIGHSLGELAAYRWAGALDEPSLMRLAVARGRAISEHGRPGGGMASLAAPREMAERLIGQLPAVVAGLNSPTQTIISGELAAIDEVLTRARSAGLPAVRLSVSHAFHSPLVADAVFALAPALSREPFRSPERVAASTITGELLDGSEDLRELLRRQLTAPVRLMDAVAAVEAKADLWIEVGPGHVLGDLVAGLVDSPVISLDAGGESLSGLLRAVGATFAMGVPVNVDAMFDDRFTRPFSLDWQGKFFVNPCETGRKADVESQELSVKCQEPTDDVKAPCRDLASSNRHLTHGSQFSAHNSPSPALDFRLTVLDSSPLEVVRRLVAERAELPPATVRAEDRLLQDLHFSSIAVGGLVADAARALGLPPPVSPTDYAHATVGEMARALDELRQTGALAAGPIEATPSGVDAWIRSFTVEYVERPLPKLNSSATPGDWQVIAPPAHPFAEHLKSALNSAVAGRGVVVCLPPHADERDISHLLHGTQQVLQQPAESCFVLVQHGHDACGWARTLHLELPNVTTCVVTLPPGHPQAVDCIVAEARAAVGYAEAEYTENNSRREPVLRLLRQDTQDLALNPQLSTLNPSDVLLVTGGGKGIAAECALALAQEYGVQLAIIGRAPASGSIFDADVVANPQPRIHSPKSNGKPHHDDELERNLARFQAAGATFRYLSADVTDAAAVRAAVVLAERELGPITAVLHGAGANVPQPLSALDETAVRQTLAPKVDGLRNVLAAVDSARLRLLVTFGSIIARTGMHGEADYALANQWLTRETEQWQREHAHCRCLCVEWSVWSGVGMGERLGRIDALQRQGITPIGPDEGVRIMRELIANPPSRTAVVVSGRFGNPPTLKLEQPDLPLLRFLEEPRVHVPGVELIVDASLSLGTDPYLRDHIYQGTPLLPAVIGLEAMAQVCTALAADCQELRVKSQMPDTLAHDSQHLTLNSFKNVEFTRPVTIPESGDRTIRVAALVRKPGQIEVVLRSDETGFQADHFRATCHFEGAAKDQHRMGRVPPDAPSNQFDVNTNAAPLLLIDPEQDLYGQILFHRGRFRRIQGYRELSATRCVAEIVPAGRIRWFAGYLPEKMLLGDPALRDAAIHAIQACIPHGTILPVGIDRVQVHRFATDHQTNLVHAQERWHEGDSFVYDVAITTLDGEELELWNGLRLQRVGHTVPDVAWAEPLLGPYFERRLAELVPGVATSVTVIRKETDGRVVESKIRRKIGRIDSSPHRLSAVEKMLADNGRKMPGDDSDLALRAAIGAAASVHRRPDGMPIAILESDNGQHTVSLAHAAALTISIAGPGTVACDAEPVIERSPSEWQNLLGAERVALAKLIATTVAHGEPAPAGGQSGQSFASACSRVWCAVECLKKAGLATHTPLMLRSSTADGWVLLAAGQAAIATWLGTVRQQPVPLAVGLLVESGG